MEKQHSWEVHNPTSFLTNLDGLQVDQNTRTAVVRSLELCSHLLILGQTERYSEILSCNCRWQFCNVNERPNADTI